MAEVRIQPNRAGMRDLLSSSALYPALERVAHDIEARAKATARVESPESAAERNRTPGRFRDSIHTQRHRGPVRVAVRVVATCEGAGAIEARDRTLGKAAG